LIPHNWGIKKVGMVVIDAEVESSKTKGACAVLEVAVNGIFVTIGDNDEE
jgi:hypothetical protein